MIPDRRIILPFRVISFSITLILCMAGAMAENPLLLSPVDDPGGNPHIRSITRLSDGRMAFATTDGIEIYDGSNFSQLPAVTGGSLELPGYDGFHHLYLSDDGRYLWIKNFKELKCVDLETELFVTDMPRQMKAMGLPSAIDDFFTDSDGRIWAVAGNRLLQPDLRLDIKLDTEKRNILDLATDSRNLYLFLQNGETIAYSLPSGKHIYTSNAFSPEEEWKFGRTSLVVDADSGFYQIRNGAIGGLFHFNPNTKEYARLMESNLRLNTLAVGDSTAFISTNDGLITVNLNSGKATHIPLIKTKSGNLLASEISTIFIDDERGLWLGMLNRGIFYHHPEAYRYLRIAGRGAASYPTPENPAFSEGRDGSITLSRPEGNLRITLPDGRISPAGEEDSPTRTGEYGSGASFVSSNGSVCFSEPGNYSIFIRNDSVKSGLGIRPVVSGILVNGERIKPLGTYKGNPILNKAAARTSEITLNPDQNFLTIEASSPRYAASPILFEYMLEGIDREWQQARGTGTNGRKLSAYYTALPAGEYIFKVRNAGEGEGAEMRMKVTVLPHWWQTGWAYAAYALIVVLLTGGMMIIFTKRTKKRIAREQREKFLLDRIKTLIEEVDRYKAESPEQESQLTIENQINGSDSFAEKEISGEAGSPEEDNSGDSSIQEPATLSEADKAFIAKAMEFVEKNLNTPGYSVVQLSRDLCMERTGLYRKLTALLEQSPSLFIRDIRLRNAARLLKEGKLSITEIAEQTGFSSTSYMSKCFQERYGCRPSEYAKAN